MSQYDRTAEDVGNIVALEHVNICVPDQQLALTFYVSGLGLTRDPYLNTGARNMWVNVGRSQFHLPVAKPQVLRGRTGIVVPDRDTLLARLAAVRDDLADTAFAFEETGAAVVVTCPWGNQVVCHQPGAEFGPMQLGMPYVEFDVARGAAPGIARFYASLIGAPATVQEMSGTRVAVVDAGLDQQLRFRETDAQLPEFDGHHIAIYLSNFSGPYRSLIADGKVSRETNQHEYRFIEIWDHETGRTLFEVEHEVRSMRHPMFARPLVNRNPSIDANTYLPGQEHLAWTRR